MIPSQTTQGRLRRRVARLEPGHPAERVRRSSPSLGQRGLARAIARETGASADHTLYGDTLGPEGSAGATYLGMEQANADAVVRGLTGGAAGCRIPGL